MLSGHITESMSCLGIRHSLKASPKQAMNSTLDIHTSQKALWAFSLSSGISRSDLMGSHSWKVKQSKERVCVWTPGKGRDINTSRDLGKDRDINTSRELQLWRVSLPCLKQCQRLLSILTRMDGHWSLDLEELPPRAPHGVVFDTDSLLEWGREWVHWVKNTSFEQQLKHPCFYSESNTGATLDRACEGLSALSAPVNAW